MVQKPRQSGKRVFTFYLHAAHIDWLKAEKRRGFSHSDTLTRLIKTAIGATDREYGGGVPAAGGKKLATVHLFTTHANWLKAEKKRTGVSQAGILSGLIKAAMKNG